MPENGMNLIPIQNQARIILDIAGMITTTMITSIRVGWVLTRMNRPRQYCINFRDFKSG